jgi:hypothetical protein
MNENRPSSLPVLPVNLAFIPLVEGHRVLYGETTRATRTSPRCREDPVGLFKDMKNLKDQTKGYKRPGLRESIHMASEAMTQVNEQQAQASELLTTGVDGTATVTQIMHTGKTVNYMPEVQMEMQVSVGGGAPEAVQHVQVISPTSIPQIQPGMTVPVKVDAADSAKIYLMVG